MVEINQNDSFERADKEVIIRFNESNLSRAVEFVKFADSKGVFFMSVALALIAGMIALIPSTMSVLTSRINICHFPYLLVGGLMLSYIVFIVSCASSIFLFMRMVSPRLAPIGENPSIAYFWDIAQMNAHQFKKSVLAINSHAYAEHLAQQTIEVSHIGAKKYRELFLGITMLYAAGGAIIVFLLFYIAAHAVSYIN